MNADAIVIGGGLVGASVAYGLARHKVRTVMLDEGDVAYRASRGNFALVWTQSKGAGAPEYQAWSRLSSEKWVELARALEEETGVDCGYRRNGGIHVCFTEEDLEKRRKLVARIREEAAPGAYDCRLLGRKELLDYLPGLGPEVFGGSYCPQDGHVNPLNTLRALHRAFLARGGQYLCEARVNAIDAAPRRFTVHAGAEKINAPILVLAAGLGNKDLGPLVGLDVPVRPVRGQVIVTERARPLLAYPTSYLRQTVEGSMLIGESREEVGFDDATEAQTTIKLAARAIRTFPAIRNLRIVRTWAALRVMSPDVHPIYDQSETFPGAFVCTCHSGVTLAAVHALVYAECVAQGSLPERLVRFSTRRFRVQAPH